MRVAPGWGSLQRRQSRGLGQVLAAPSWIGILPFSGSVDWFPQITGPGPGPLPLPGGGTVWAPDGPNGVNLIDENGNYWYWNSSGRLTSGPPVVGNSHGLSAALQADMLVIPSGTARDTVTVPTRAAPAPAPAGGLLPGMHWATPIPGGVPGVSGNVYVFPAWNPTTGQYDPAAQIPAGARTISLAALAATGYTGLGGGFAQSEADANNPESGNFGKNWQNSDGSVGIFDASVPVQVAFWIMQGDDLATATTQATKAAQLLKSAVVAIPSGVQPSDPLYAKLQALGIVAPAPPVTAPGAVDTTYATPPGQSLPVSAPVLYSPGAQPPAGLGPDGQPAAGPVDATAAAASVVGAFQQSLSDHPLAWGGAAVAAVLLAMRGRRGA